MRVSTQLLAAGLALPLAVSAVHGVHSRRHIHHNLRRSSPFSPILSKRQEGSVTCPFPTDAGLVAVTPEFENAGWAMSPDQPCKTGMYCPYACPSGQLMNQWDPSATTYTYPQSQNGGLYCNENGQVEIPFPDRPLCVDGAGTVQAVNKAGNGNIAICQTVLPGNEAMLIPTDVNDQSTLAVPDPSYWASTAAHYYVNPPGVSTEDGCVWGTKEEPVGNWAPYVAGANQVANGDTYVTIGWNPIYLEPETPFREVVPGYGIRIECEGGGCNGLPCYIDPQVHGVNDISQGTTGAGGANFCVVTVPQGETANVVVFDRVTGGTKKSVDKVQKDTTTKPEPSKKEEPVKKAPKEVKVEEVPEEKTTSTKKEKTTSSQASTTSTTAKPRVKSSSKTTSSEEASETEEGKGRPVEANLDAGDDFEDGSNFAAPTSRTKDDDKTSGAGRNAIGFTAFIGTVVAIYASL